MGSGVGVGKGVAVGVSVGVGTGVAVGVGSGVAVGAGVGALVGVGLRKFIRQYEWSDVAAASVLGLGIGASAKGSVLGFAAGSAAGFLLWRFHPSVGPGGAVAWALAGLAVGGLGQWVADAVQGNADPSVIPLSFSVPL